MAWRANFLETWKYDLMFGTDVGKINRPSFPRKKGKSCKLRWINKLTGYRNSWEKYSLSYLAKWLLLPIFTASLLNTELVKVKISIKRKVFSFKDVLCRIHSSTKFTTFAICWWFCGFSSIIWIVLAMNIFFKDIFSRTLK